MRLAPGPHCIGMGSKAAEGEPHLAAAATLRTPAPHVGLAPHVGAALARRRRRQVELSQLQRTTYRSILERNFDWLNRGGVGEWGGEARARLFRALRGAPPGTLLESRPPWADPSG